MLSYVDHLIGQPDTLVKMTHQEQIGQNLFFVLEVNSSSASVPNATNLQAVHIAVTAGE